MKKKYINDLANLYVEGISNAHNTQDAINENVEVSDLKSNINDAAGLAPADSGPNVSGVQLPIDNGDNDTDGISNQNITQNVDQTEKEKKKPENLNERSINNSTMSKPNIFDKLYATIMEAEDLDELDSLDSGLEDETSSEDEFEELSDESGDGEEITLSLPRDLAEKLHDALMSQLGGDEEGDDLDDFGGDEGDDDLDFGDDDPLMEGGESKASGKATGSKDGGQPKPAADGKGHLQSKKHEVKSTVKPKGSGHGDGGAGGMENEGAPVDCNVAANKHLSNPKGSNKVSDAEWG